MDPEKLLAAITALVDGMKADMATISEKCDSISAKYDALAKKRDSDDDLTEPTAADSRRADSIAADLRNLHNRVNAMDIHSRQNAGTRDQFADIQAKADVAYRSWNESCPPPFASEGLLDYAIRVTRPLQKHSKKWAKAELHALARDPSTLASVCDAIRSDAVAASMDTTEMPMFQHREVHTQSAAGHRITSFIGKGSIYKQLSRPARYVTAINGDYRYGRSGGGSVVARDAH
jgi:hypothetical protein